MLIECSLIIYDLVSPVRKELVSHRSYLFTQIVTGKYYLCVSNSTYANRIHYDIAMLEKILYKNIKERKMGLLFKDPKQVLMATADSSEMLYLFYRQLNDIIDGKNIIIGKRHNLPKIEHNENCYNLVRYSNPLDSNVFDNILLKINHLSKIVMENCDLPKIPINIGNLPIRYLSISGSNIPTSQFDQNIYWNWMSMKTISCTLVVLKINAIGLKLLPFELLFLKNLQSLSASKNFLTFLPHFIAEMKKLNRLIVADNMLTYYPDRLSRRSFKTVDISNNLFDVPESLRFKHLTKYLNVFGSLKRPDKELNVKPLSHLSFYSLIKTRIPFIRQDIPQTLWLFYDVVGRCAKCNKCILPDYSVISHRNGLPRAINLIKDQNTINIPLQFLLCRVSRHLCVRR
ncbi:uncharacterized protein LOC112600278 [Melanaphis sacchari]|uniref:uncharacterized protein LOC112600278 n=1 Tax=Melanaphis sacchari TaxID=742174 RepID=UPI000DC13C54|nr:uncharacterized protein LOC112600278 [Melanaphis sacchari]